MSFLRFLITTSHKVLGLYGKPSQRFAVASNRRALVFRVIGKVLHLARICLQVVQFINIKTVLNILPAPIVIHHMCRELLWSFRMMIDCAKAGDFSED